MNDASPAGPDQPSLSNAPIVSNDVAASAETAAQYVSNTEERKRIQRDRKIAMLDNLIRNIDITIYAQLSALYYLEYISG